MISEYLDKGSVFIIIMSIIIAKYLIYDIIFNYIFWVRRTDKMLSEIPLFGDTLSYFKDSESIFGYSLRHVINPDDRLTRALEMVKGHKRNALFKFGLQRIVVLIEPEDIKNGLNRSETIEKAKIYDFFSFVLGSGIFNSPVPKWKKMRPIVNKAFMYKQLQRYMDHLNGSNKMLMVDLSKNINEEIDLQCFYSNLSVKSILETFFGYDCDDDRSRHWINNFRMIIEESVNLAVYSFRSPFICDKFILRNEHRRIFDEIIKLPKQVFETKKREYFKKKDEGLHDENEYIEDKNEKLIDILLKLMENGNISEKEVLDEITTLLAGNDLMSITVPTVLLLLAMHPDIQDNVYNELYSVFGDSDRDLTWDDLSKLQFMEQCINESLRMFPPAGVILRSSVEDVPLREFTIPKGCSIMVPIYAIHNNEEIYPEPNKFDPERFTPENMKKRHSNSFIPFSYGRRGCVARNFALISMKCMLSYILRNFLLSSNMKIEDIKLKMHIFLCIRQGYHVTIKPRIRIPI